MNLAAQAAAADAPFARSLRERKPSERKLPALDGIRGLAILAVMAHHSFSLIQSNAGPLTIVKWIFSLGWAGVDLFFVLSGFLITGILLDTRTAANYFQSFYARRALRIFPLYVAFVAVALVVFPMVVPSDWLAVPGDRWLYVCYLANWLALWKGPWRHSVMAHLWSLAVEEQFYFCWPLLVWALRPAVLLPALVAAEGAVIAGRAWWVLAHGTSQAVWLATATRMDGLLLGAICAIVVRRTAILPRPLPWMAAAGLYAYLFLALRFPSGDWFNQTAGIPLLAVCFALIVFYAVVTDGARNPFQRTLCWRPLMRVGKYAYGIYIFHVPLLYFENRLIGVWAPVGIRGQIWFGCAAMAALFWCSYSIASLSYRHFESYFLNWKDRFAARYAS